MGLDMYLKVKVVPFDWRLKEKEKEKEKVFQAISSVFPGLSDIFSENKLPILVFDFAYWRKFNALHYWFVENIQESVDDCKEYYVSYEKIKELNSLLKHILESKNDAEKLLPTKEGFFFGNTDYDENYFKDIEFTIERLGLLESLLEKENLDSTEYSLEVFYQSSW